SSRRMVDTFVERICSRQSVLIPALRPGVEGSGIHRASSSQPLCLLRCNPDLDFFGNGSGNLLLKTEYITKIPFIGVRKNLSFFRPCSNDSDLNPYIFSRL